MSKKIIVAGNEKMLMPIITQIMAMHQLIEAKDIGTVYAYHNDLNSVRRAGKPKVNLFFLEDSNFNKRAATNNIAEGRRRERGLISFRLMNETTQSLSKSNATVLANKIKITFDSNSGFVWNKGKTLYSYCDWLKGYQLQLLCKTKTEAKRIVTTVLSLQNHAPDWKNFNVIENEEEIAKYPENPGTHVVMGETLPLPHERPLVDVRFQYAYMTLDGVKEPITLYDKRHKRVGSLVV